MTKLIALKSIRLDDGAQSRAKINRATVDEYAEAIKAGATLPPIVVFDDGSVTWCADGFHRCRAAIQAERSRIAADVRKGTRRDALLFSVGANATHGLPRTNADKRRAVTLLLEDEEWTARSDRWIAAQCVVGHSFVSNVRSELSTVDSSDTREGQDGKKRRKRKKEVDEDQDQDEPFHDDMAVGRALDALKNTVSTWPDHADLSLLARMLRAYADTLEKRMERKAS